MSENRHTFTTFLIKKISLLTLAQTCFIYILEHLKCFTRANQGKPHWGLESQQATEEQDIEAAASWEHCPEAASPLGDSLSFSHFVPSVEHSSRFGLSIEKIL